MNLSTWWLFVLMTFVVSATPGPNMLLIMSISARYGVRTATTAMVGCMTALLLMMSVSAAGLGAVLQTFPAVFEALRLAGAAYLAYLGVKCWRAPVHTQSDGKETIAPVLQGVAVFRQGFLVAASNPKAILFAAAFFPQFLNPQREQLPQFAVLLATFAVIEVSWYFVYAASGKRLSAYLQHTQVMRAFNRITGAVFVGFAALMAVSRD